MLPEEIEKVAAALAELPGIGPRQALRLAFFLAREKKPRLLLSLESLNKLKLCKKCFFPHSSAHSLCSICSDTKRDELVIALVEKETDLLSLEKTKSFSGVYFILGEAQKSGVLSPEAKSRIEALKSEILGSKEGEAKEIILALSPTAYGDLSVGILERELSGFAKKITRLGRGLPTGGEVEFADEQTLKESLKNRG